MTLENFFTLTEMKDGLTTPCRVKELVAVMQMEKNSFVKNIGEATRLWSTIAGTIIATVNKECLDLFIQLDGLGFIDRWLKDAQTFPTEGSDWFVEEAISTLLQAVEKLEIDNERLTTSEIYITVQSLISYKSTRVQDKARALFDSWKAKDVEGGNIKIPNDQNRNHAPCLAKLESDRGDLSREEVCPSDGKRDPQFPTDSKQGTSEAISEVLKSESIGEDATHDNKIENFPNKLGQIEISSASGVSGVRDTLSRTDSSDTEKVIAKLDAGTKDDLSMKTTSVDDMNPLVGESSNGKETEDLGTTLSKREDVGVYDEVKSHCKSESKYFGNTSGFERMTKNNTITDITGDMDLEDGTVDALEVARLVAKEVEREVVGYGEQSGISSESITTGAVRQLGSLESVNTEQDLINELPKMENVSSEESEKEPLTISANPDSSPENHIQDVESSQVTHLQELEINTEKNVCDFDLNQEVLSEELDLNIDLNVAEVEDVMIVNSMLGKQNPILPRFPSGESSVELSPKISERLKFDLNQIEEDGHIRARNFLNSPSPASSSCLQPSMRNFDLNDNPINFLGESSSSKVDPYVGPYPYDSGISIFGTKVKKSTFPSQTLFPFPNGRTTEPFMGFRPTAPYVPSICGYNGLTMGPTGSFSSGPMYGPHGPVPYPFDSRGVPLIPQIMGSASTVPSSYFQPSLVMNMVGATPGSNGAGPLGPNLDLNSGFGAQVGNNRDPLFFRELFISGQGSSGVGGGKRKEPESGWDLFPTNYNHHQPPHL